MTQTSTTNRYHQLFKRCEAENRAAFIPFVMLHDPDFDRCMAVIDCLVAAGADALELGLPFSDPVADGPVIQKAALRALHSGATFERCCQLMERIRQKYPQLPIGLLCYANSLVGRGLSKAYEKLAMTGTDSVLIADAPVAEIARFHEQAVYVGLDQVLIAPPDSSDALLQRMASYASGYTYVLGRAGVTGTHCSSQLPDRDFLKRLHSQRLPPAVLGFGVSTPEQVSAAANAGFAGVISGSAVVQRLVRAIESAEGGLTELAQFVTSMRAATERNSAPSTASRVNDRLARPGESLPTADIT